MRRPLFHLPANLPCRFQIGPRFAVYEKTPEPFAIDLELALIFQNPEDMAPLVFQHTFKLSDLGRRPEGAWMEIWLPRIPICEIECNASGVIKRFEMPNDPMIAIREMDMFHQFERQRVERTYLLPDVELEVNERAKGSPDCTGILGYVNFDGHPWPIRSFPSLDRINYSPLKTRRSKYDKAKQATKQMFEVNFLDEGEILVELEKLACAYGEYYGMYLPSGRAIRSWRGKWQQGKPF